MEQLVTTRDVLEKTRLSRSTLHRLVKAGQFPKAIQIGPQAIRWRLSDLEAWLEAKAESGQAA